MVERVRSSWKPITFLAIWPFLLFMTPLFFGQKVSGVMGDMPGGVWLSLFGLLFAFKLVTHPIIRKSVIGINLINVIFWGWVWINGWFGGYTH